MDGTSRRPHDALYRHNGDKYIACLQLAKFWMSFFWDVTLRKWAM